MNSFRPFILGALVALLALALPAAASARPVKYHDHGSHVRVLQKALHIHVDGAFGIGTLHAVKRFQHKHGLKADGIPGPQFWAAIRRANRRSSTSGGGSHKVVSRGAAVKVLQRRIGVSADGVFGPGTLAAVKRFQRRKGLKADGVVGNATWRALGVHSSQPTLKAMSSHHASSGGSSGGGSGAPTRIRWAIKAGNRIATRPYKYGGGHGSFRDSGYDCSGSVSYVLHAAHALNVPRTSGDFEHYGGRGHGRYITIYANAGHVFMTIRGHRYDTSGMDDGTRWDRRHFSTSGYTVRHPIGL